MTRGGAPAPSRVLRALAAVVAGNVLYFVVVARWLPEAARHRPFAFDFGLALDFALCAALYFALGRLSGRGKPGGG